MEQIQKYLVPGFGPEETTILLDARGSGLAQSRLDGRPSRDYCEVY